MKKFYWLIKTLSLEVIMLSISLIVVVEIIKFAS